MIKEGKFGPQEAIWLAVAAIAAKLFYTRPARLAALVGTTGWYTTLISFFVSIVGFTFIYLLLKRFPGKDIIEIYEITLGRFFGFIFSAIFALIMIYLSAIRMREFTEVLKVYVLPVTPITLILFLFISTVAILNILGLEVIARIAKLFALALSAGFFIVLVLGYQNYDIHNLFPILGYGMGKTLYQGVIASSGFGEVIILAIFAPSLQGIRHIKNSGYVSLALSGVLVITAYLAYIMTFPYYVAEEVTSPMYELVTLIDYGRFLQRVDPVFMFVMAIGSLLSVSIVFYAFVSIYCKMFRIQDTRPVILAASIIAFALAISQKSISDLIFSGIREVREYSGVVFYIFPLISLIAAKLRKKGCAKDA